MASSLGKCPRFFVILRSDMFRDSMALVVHINANGEIYCLIEYPAVMAHFDPNDIKVENGVYLRLKSVRRGNDNYLYKELISKLLHNHDSASSRVRKVSVIHPLSLEYTSHIRFMPNTTGLDATKAKYILDTFFDFVTVICAKFNISLELTLNFVTPVKSGKIALISSF